MPMRSFQRLANSASHVAAVLDSQHAGKTVNDVTGFGGDIPIVATLDEGIARGADALLVGVAMHGAGLPPGLLNDIRTAIDRGLEIWNGLHAFVGDDAAANVDGGTHTVFNKYGKQVRIAYVAIVECNSSTRTTISSRINL